MKPFAVDDQGHTVFIGGDPSRISHVQVFDYELSPEQIKALHDKWRGVSVRVPVEKPVKRRYFNRSLNTALLVLGASFLTSLLTIALLKLIEVILKRSLKAKVTSGLRST